MQSTQCIECVHYQGNMTCDAFEERIPEIIITGQHDHTSAYPGDNGIRFEPIAGSSNYKTE